ncbi:DUF397 domain-containing protein [Streptomyces sp. NPDC046866]|uniref:DUF397 domain-containing protein n=1 Tax=Streptomyces sp. NPDC046866 TaxID=3154921 RepID=UPI003454A809
MHDFDFRTSSYSKGQADQECVEVATNVVGTVAVRDSKRGAGPTVQVSDAAWAVFLGAARAPSAVGRRPCQTSAAPPSTATVVPVT